MTPDRSPDEVEVPDGPLVKYGRAHAMVVARGAPVFTNNQHGE